MDKNEQNKLDDKKRSNTIKTSKETKEKHPTPKEHDRPGAAIFAPRKVGKAHKHKLEDTPQTDDRHGDIIKKGRHYSQKPRGGSEPFGGTNGPEFHPDLKPVPHNQLDHSFMKPDAPEKAMPNRMSDSANPASQRY